MNGPVAQRPVAAGRTAIRPLTILYHHRTRSRDGQSIHIDELIHALRQEGHKIVVIEPQRVDATQGSLKKQLLPKFLYETLEFGYSFLEFAKLAAAAYRIRPDALYERANILMLSGVWTARLFRLPFLLEVNAPLTKERAKFDGLSFPKFAAWTEHCAWRAADRILPVTRVLAQELEDAGVSSDRIVVTPNGVDLDKLKIVPLEQAKKACGLGSGLVLGFVGFVREWHGLENIVELLATDSALAEAHLLIVGDGPACGSIRERAAKVGVTERVTITGIVPHNKLPGYVSAMDIALQPEVTAYASPLKLFEYMALARAIVAPNTPNICEILEHEADSLLFTPGDHAALAAAIRTLAVDPALRARLSAAAANKIVTRGLTWRRNAQRVAALIADMSAPARASQESEVRL